MLRRLIIGLVKGALIGALIGGGLHFGLHWTKAGTLLGYLVSMAAATTAGVLAGKAPWRRDAGIETVLKAAVGLGLGALFYYVQTRWLAAKLPLSIPTFPADAKWTEIPLLVALTSSTLYGMLVELDNTEQAPPAEPPKSGAPKGSREIEDAELVEPRNKKALRR